MMKTNDAGVALIKEFEGLRLEAYPDPAHGWSVPTIGYGHTSAAGAPVVTKGMRITADEAEAILRRDLGQYERAVSDAVRVPLSANQFAALVSFTFNLGAGNLRSSTLLKKLNASDYSGAAAEFKRWNKAGGKVRPGLTRRRAAEGMLFLSSPIFPKFPPVEIVPDIGNPISKPTGLIATILALLARIFGGKK